MPGELPPPKGPDLNLPMRRSKVIGVTVQIQDGKVFVYTIDRVLLEVQAGTVKVIDKRVHRHED